MTPDGTHPSVSRFPADPPQEADAVQSGLDMLGSWRQASAATAIAAVALLPFAIAWHVTYLVAIWSALIAAAILFFCCQVAWRTRLASLAIHPRFAYLPELAPTRRRLVSRRSRRSLARGLRSAAAPTRPPARFDCCPVLGDRVAAERTQILAIASALEQALDADPVCVALIHELLADGSSPLYSKNVPAADLHNTLKRVAEGLLVEPPV